MRTIIPILLLCLLSCFARSQKLVEKHFLSATGKKLALNLQIADSIRIITWTKNEVFVKGSVNINDNKDNDIYLTSFEENGNSLEVSAKFDEDKSRRNWSDSCHCCCNYVSKIYWDIYIPENTSFAVETIDGNIIIDGKTDEIKAHTISGFIDLVFNTARKADLKMSTISGTIYTNLALSKPEGRKGGNQLSTEINGGGKRVDLETISGDIFLRKGE